MSKGRCARYRTWLGYGLLVPLMGLMACGGESIPLPVNESPAPSPAQVAWVQKVAKPFETTEPEGSDGDLAFLEALAGDATVFGMGEATHGSSEFQKMKHRVFRYLVEYKGVVAFGLEAQMGRCRAIDHYIQTGEGDPVSLVQFQGFWVWSTQEMLDLVQWMRVYNLDPAHPTKLRFFGFDMQDGGVESHAVVDYLKTVDAAAAGQIDALYASFRPYTWEGGLAYASAEPSVRDDCHRKVQSAYQWMLDHEVAYSDRTGAEAFAWALQMARVVADVEVMMAASDRLGVLNARDEAMAANVEWYHRMLPAGSKIALSAHNLHIAKSTPWRGWLEMGGRLSTRYGAAYRTFGFTFETGEFQARFQDGNGNIGALGVNRLDAAMANSPESVLAKSGHRLAMLDLSLAGAAEVGSEPFYQPYPTINVGAAWNGNPSDYMLQESLASEYDILIFIQKVHATQVL